jgi:putative mRNA 3-end processing factor
MPPHPKTWLKTTPAGLYCEPGDFYIDPTRPVGRAVITHAHADHARPGHEAVLATEGTLAVMRTRMGAERAGGTQQSIGYGVAIKQKDVTVTLFPAGHVLGSAQILMEYQGARAVVSGDYKRQADPTCAPFEPVACDVFVTEATFGLPVFHHPPAADEINRLLRSVDLFPERSHVVGCYALGKCQRLIALLRQCGYDRPTPPSWTCKGRLFWRRHRPSRTAGRGGWKTRWCAWRPAGCASVSAPRRAAWSCR